MRIIIALLLWASTAGAYTITGGESDTSSTLWWFIPAAGCNAGVAASNWDTATPDMPTAACASQSTNVGPRGVLAFNDGTGTNIVTPSIYQTLLLPQAPTPATAAYTTNAPITITLMWYSIGASGNVEWCARVGCRADAEVDDAVALDAVVCVVDAAKTTTLQLNTAVITLPTASTDTCTANKLLHMRIYRDSDDGTNDTTSGDANLESVTIAWQRFQ